MKMTKELRNLVAECVEGLLLEPERRSVIGFMAPLSRVRMRVKATRIKNNGDDMRVSIGPPNSREQDYLKLCKKAGTIPRKCWIKFFRNS